MYAVMYGVCSHGMWQSVMEVARVTKYFPQSIEDMLCVVQAHGPMTYLQVGRCLAYHILQNV